MGKYGTQSLAAVSNLELKSQPRSQGFSLEGGRGGKNLSREGKVIFNFGIWLHHMKTGNIYIFFDKLDSRKATCQLWSRHLTAITPGVTLLSKSSHACGRKSKSHLF